ncbi:MAG: hypothetical protein GY791_20920 [Alphaproteobacteria bacterium]|nr:hypothetical protein [Alphaproteobacteria bacterium]
MQGRILATATVAAIAVGAWGLAAQAQQVTISVPTGTPGNVLPLNAAPTQINLGQTNNVINQGASAILNQIGHLTPAQRLRGDEVAVEDNAIQAVFSANNAENSALVAGSGCIGNICSGAIAPNTASIAASTAQVFYGTDSLAAALVDTNFIGANFRGAIDTGAQNTSIKVDANNLLSRAAGNRLQQDFAGEYQTLDQTGGGTQTTTIDSTAVNQLVVDNGGNITSAYSQLITETASVTGSIGNGVGVTPFDGRFENFIGIINANRAINNLDETLRVLNNSATAFAAGNDAVSSITGETGPHRSAIVGFQNATSAVAITAIAQNMGIGFVTAGAISNSTTRTSGNVIAAIGAGNNAVNDLGTGTTP